MLPMDLNSTEDVKRSLGLFILEHLFSDTMIMGGHTHGGTYANLCLCVIIITYVRTYVCINTDNSKTLLQYILKKFLLLVYFLDQAKLTRLIDFDPCLFQTTSSLKVLISSTYIHSTNASYFNLQDSELETISSV